VKTERNVCDFFLEARLMTAFHGFFIFLSLLGNTNLYSKVFYNFFHCILNILKLPFVFL
jgi:hypothetical protein